MESTSLASTADAELLLKLYDLRREQTMRAARLWVTVDFQPASAEDAIAVLKNFGSQQNQYLRQVTTYWEMAASFVLRGAIDGDLFVECNAENVLILAKFQPFLEQIRADFPEFLVRTEQVINKYATSRAMLERAIKVVASMKTVPLLSFKSS
jgi:hypothetical protein